RSILGRRVSYARFLASPCSYRWLTPPRPTLAEAARRYMAHRCGCASKTSLATRWSSRSNASSSSGPRNCLEKEKAVRTRTTNTSTCCPISDGGSRFVSCSGRRSEEAGSDHLRGLLAPPPLHLFVPAFPPRLGTG